MEPLLHDLAGETVLVLGGGAVGARRARRFARTARVVVVSPTFADADFGDAERVRAAPTPDEVAGWVRRADPALVVAATDDAAVNAAAERAAVEADALANRADRRGERPVHGVAVPATVREDPVVVAVTSGGTAPTVSRELRRRLAAELDGAGEVARGAAAVRYALDRRDVPTDPRRAALRAVAADEAVWSAARDGDGERVRHAAFDAAERALRAAGIEASLRDED